MPWERSTTKLSCGCTIYSDYDTTDPGQEAWCDVHQEQIVERISRVSEQAGSPWYRRKDKEVKEQKKKEEAAQSVRPRAEVIPEEG